MSKEDTTMEKVTEGTKSILKNKWFQMGSAAVAVGAAGYAGRKYGQKETLRKFNIVDGIDAKV